MPVLPYCIILAGVEAEPPATGVCGTAIESAMQDGLCCFYSIIADASITSASDVKTQALRFAEVVRRLLATTGVIPFRFPTLLASADELRVFMSEHAAQYSATLQRLKDVVQMELRIEHARFPTAAETGTAYLQSRATAARALSEAAESAQTAAGDLTSEWRTRDTAHGLRCYALVRRERVAEFQTRMRSLSTPEGVTIVVSGPWPAAEFLNDTVQP